MTTLNYNNKQLQLKQQAFIDRDFTNGCDVYKAHAIDNEGNEYEILWQITVDNPANCEDESNMCDWGDYTVRAI